MKDLTDVPLEVAVPASWQEEMISIPDLEQLLGEVKFPKEVVDAGQFGSPVAEGILASPAARGLTRRALASEGNGRRHPRLVDVGLR